MGLGAKGQAPVLVEGARVTGSVTGVERYGVFVQIAGTQGVGLPAVETTR